MLDSQCLCINLRRAARGVSRHYDGALDGFGINVAQYSLLCNLQRLNEPSISALAEAMGLDRSTCVVLGPQNPPLEPMIPIDADRLVTSALAARLGR